MTTTEPTDIIISEGPGRYLTGIDPREAHYTDGAVVAEGDHIRFHQAPGGLLSPASDAHGDVLWVEGVAERTGWPKLRSTVEDRQRIVDYMLKVGSNLCHPDELCLVDAKGRRYNLVGHVIERLA